MTNDHFIVVASTERHLFVQIHETFVQRHGMS